MVTSTKMSTNNTCFQYLPTENYISGNTKIYGREFTRAIIKRPVAGLTLLHDLEQVMLTLSLVYKVRRMD